MSPRPRSRRLRTLLTAAASAAALSACTLPVDVHGNLPSDDDIAKLQPGEQGRNEVVQILGAPSVESTFHDDTWYYVGVKQTQFAFFEPNVKERNVLVLTFDDRDQLARKRLYTQADMQDVDPVDRVTPTEGRDLTILQQLIGNIGRFSGGDGGPSGAGRRGPIPGPGG